VKLSLVKLTLERVGKQGLRLLILWLHSPITSESSILEPYGQKALTLKPSCWVILHKLCTVVL